MKRLAGLFLLVVPLMAKQAIVRVYGTESQILSWIKASGLKGFDRVGGKFGEYTDFWAHSDGEIMAFRSSSLPVEIIDPDPVASMEKSKASYRSWSQVQSFIESVPNNYPNICVLDTIGWSYQGRPIYMLKISDNPGSDEDEPEVLIMGLHHAREWPALETPLFIIDSLTKAYGSNSTITDAVNNNEIYFVPCVNPDGYVYSHDQGHDWRKNRHYFPSLGAYGTDPNRNYDGAEDGDPEGIWGAVDQSKATHSPDYETHTGLMPGDSEITAVMRFVKQRNLDVSISYHTYSELVLWPIGYTYADAPDDTLLTRLGTGMASVIGGYNPQQASDLYPTSGDSDDWIYGWYYYTGGRVVPAYTVEEGSSFQPPTYALDTIVVENFRGALYLIQQASHVRNNVVPYPIIGSVSAPDTTANTIFTVSWSMKNPNSNPSAFQVQQMTGYTRATDDAESNYGYLDLSGWSRSTTRSHSGSYSYAANNVNDATDMLSTRWPFYVENGDSLSFWLWYDTEEEYDVVEVAVSTNGRDWDFLDCFWGSSNWTRKSYDLSPWAGEWLYFAVFYMTDGSYRGNGVYLDDINIAYFSDTTTLTTSATGSSYDITVSDTGTYYHRVKPRNVRGWADWSYPVKTVVRTTGVAEANPGPGPVIRPTTRGFEFSVPAGSDYSITVFDVAGRQVQSLAGKSTGERSSITGLGHGVFYGVLETGSRSYRATTVITK